MSDALAAPSTRQFKNVREGFWLMLALLALVPAGKAILYDTMDPDSFIHLQAADQMARDGIGPILDRQSYMSIQEKWTPYSWLAEFAMKFIWDHGTYRAALITHALMASALVCLYALASATRTRECERPKANLNVILAMALGAFLSIPYLSFRPVTMALVIMAVCVWLLIRDRMGGEKTRGVWLVIPLAALLVNIHLYAIILPAWIAALWAGAMWEWIRSAPDAKMENRRRILRYTLLGVGVSLACLATPMLPGFVKSIFFYQFGDAMVAGPTVKEYQPFYYGTSGQISAGLVLIVLVTAIARIRQLRAGEIFWLLGSVVLLLRMGRFSPVFAMVAAPIFAAAMAPTSGKALGMTAARLAVLSVLGVGLWKIVPAIPGPSTSLDQWMNRNGPNLPGYPSSAAKWVEKNITPHSGRIINNYTWGGYLSWRLGPQYKVLLDGRTNLFTREFWHAAYFGSIEERTELLRSAHADAAILPLGDSSFEPILTGMGWKTPYTDAWASVLVPPDEQK